MRWARQLVCEPLSIESLVKAKLKLPMDIGNFPGVAWDRRKVLSFFSSHRARVSSKCVTYSIIPLNESMWFAFGLMVFVWVFQVFLLSEVQSAPWTFSTARYFATAWVVSSIQRAWCILKELESSNQKNRSLDEALDEKHVSLSIVAVRDDFVVYRGRPCGRVVISLGGYLATVFFMEAKLSGLDAGLGDVCHLADQIGLLDDVKPQSWEVVKAKAVKTSWFRRGTVLCLRVFAGTASGNLSKQMWNVVVNVSNCLTLSSKLKSIVYIYIYICIIWLYLPTSLAHCSFWSIRPVYANEVSKGSCGSFGGFCTMASSSGWLCGVSIPGPCCESWDVEKSATWCGFPIVEW